MSAELNRTLASGIWRWCRDAGVRHVVLCAGARNAPLMLPMLGKEPFAKVWHHFDERAAAFFALGLTKATGQPTVVVTTSGTAVAECLPAVIEAHYSALPLIILSADRPRSFRGSGAPQAIEQKAIFGDTVEAAFDIEDAQGVDRLRGLRWTLRGPLHINTSFDEPPTDSTELEDLGAPAEIKRQERTSGVAWGFAEFLSAMVTEGGGVVILGEIEPRNDDRGCVTEFVRALGLPVFAEAQSGLRESEALKDLLIFGGDRSLKVMSPKFVLRIGGVPSCRFWRDLENLEEIEVFSVTPSGFVGLAREARVWETELSSLAQLNPPESRAEIPATSEPDFAAFPTSEPAIFRRLSEAIPCEAAVFLGNSLPIREWNLAASFEAPHPNIFASRGANGIDGQVSTFLGIAAEASQEAWCILGDLTALYDLNAPWILSQLDEDHAIRMVVINNAGGRIFSRLQAFAGVDEPGKKVIENHHQLDFQAWAAMWQLDYVRIEGGEPIESMPKRAVVEIVPDNAQTEAFYATATA